MAAVSVELAPLQMAVGEADAVTVGKGFTVTETEAVPEQPAAVVPVTVYVVVPDGLTEMLDPDPPILQPYVLAPDAVSVEACPLQMAAGLAEAVTVGKGFTVIVTVAVPEHPVAVVPVTEYVVVAEGLTVYGLFVELVFHV